MKCCMFCKKEIREDSVVDVCLQCGHMVWGDKMFKAIEDNMKKARDVGDLYQGSVTNIPNKTNQKGLPE